MPGLYFFVKFHILHYDQFHLTTIQIPNFQPTPIDANLNRPNPPIHGYFINDRWCTPSLTNAHKIETHKRYRKLIANQLSPQITTRITPCPLFNSRKCLKFLKVDRAVISIPAIVLQSRKSRADPLRPPVARRRKVKFKPTNTTTASDHA